MNTAFALVIIALCASSAVADVYLHNMRGSNNRNCRNDNNDRRRNANRLFDSQNNDKGGYSCPRAYPFKQGQEGTATVNEYGDITGSTNGQHIDTPTMYFYEGTTIPLEWTNQHGCGSNSNLDCRVVVQYMCNTDAPENSDATLASLITNKYIRDGTPIQNNSGDNTDDEATTTIPKDINDNDCDPSCDLDGRYGYHESHAWYEWCENRERNKGLFTADQLPITGNNKRTAKFTRQDDNGNRHGLECPEERDYYPYWTPTMWKDVAIGVSPDQMENCQNNLAPESQNVINKCYCDMSNVQNPQTPLPNQEGTCNAASGTWKCKGRWGLDAPTCFELPWMRDNHLGNAVDGYPMAYNWTLPSPPDGKSEMRCVLRLRYNTTTMDFPQDIDFQSNCAPNDNECTNSPIADRNNREELTYINYFGTGNEKHKLSLAVNTDQYARTFQDRSYAFDIKKRTSAVNDLCEKEIVNLNMRGKRGNIVQVYPSVEYDFSPQDVLVEQQDCLHIQWSGSDYNPNRNPNNAEGGPYNPNNQNEAKADRTNMVEMDDAGNNYPAHFSKVSNPLFSDEDGNADYDTMQRMAFLDQNINDCDTFEQLVQRNPNNRQARERDPRNCAKLNAQTTPYFDGGLTKVWNKGSHKFVSTRNNNFSNRSQKLKIDVTDCTYNCGGDDGLSGAQVAGIIIGVLAGVGILGFAGYTLARRKNIRFNMPSRPAVQRTHAVPMNKPQV